MKKAIQASMLFAALGAAGAVQAADEIDGLNLLTQAQFKSLSEDLASATSYKALTPAEPLGIAGFDVGIEATVTTLNYETEFNAACSGCSNVDSLTIPKLHLHKGLPMGFDVGLMYASAGDASIELTGLELRYANMEGGIATPAVSTRLSYSKLGGVDDLSLTTTGLDISVSKGIAMFTPYAGIGYNWVTSDPAASTGLDKESFNQTKFYVGFNLNLGLLNFDIEADKTGKAQTIGAKVGFRF